MTNDQTHDQLPEPIVTSDDKPVSPPYFDLVGINEAARLVGKGKQQIYRDIVFNDSHFEQEGSTLLIVG